MAPLDPAVVKQPERPRLRDIMGPARGRGDNVPVFERSWIEHATMALAYRFSAHRRKRI
jgi:hypothetical protein